MGYSEDLLVSAWSYDEMRELAGLDDPAAAIERIDVLWNNISGQWEMYVMFVEAEV